MTETDTSIAATTDAGRPAKKAGLWHRLYHGETAYDFIGKRRRWFVLSAVLILVGLLSLFTRGLNQGIDFKGGTVWELPANNLSVAKVRDTLRPEGLAEAKIQTVKPRSGEARVRVQGDLSDNPAKQAKIRAVSERLGKLAGIPANQVNVNDVGPSWGKDVSHKAERALVFFFIAIALYITIRFEWKMALAALAAVVHDILVTVGIYSLSGFEVTPATVVAFLTILGYSLYDTIVVFDKIEENTHGLAAGGRMTYADAVNLSMNQVLMRSLNTSLVAILPILSVLIVGAYGLGAIALEDFGLALLIGLLTGAYSSIFIASPMLAWLKEREPKYAALRQRVATRGGGVLTPAAAAAMAGGAGTGAGGATRSGDGEERVLRPASVAASSGGPGKPSGARPAGGPRPSGNRPPPRGRKKGKKR